MCFLELTKEKKLGLPLFKATKELLYQKQDQTNRFVSQNKDWIRRIYQVYLAKNYALSIEFTGWLEDGNEKITTVPIEDLRYYETEKISFRVEKV